MGSSIFEKQPPLKPSAMATVAERRFEDAQALRDTGENARANGAAYVAGFVIEILLKARLVDKYPSIARKRQHEVADDEREVWALIWRQHNLEGMLDQLPEVESALMARGGRDRTDYLRQLKKLCGTWTIQARYSSRQMRMDEANDIVEGVRTLKELLK